MLAPVLAQVAALVLADRTESRVIHDRYRTDVEFETRPATALELSWPRGGVAARYDPILTIAPLDSSTPEERSYRSIQDREIDYLHATSARARWTFGSEPTTLTLEQTASYEQRDLLREALATGFVGPAGAPGGASSPAPVPGAPSDTPVPPTLTPGGAGENVNWGSLRSSATVNHAFSRTVSLGVGTGYEVSGGLDAESREPLPVIHGPDATADLTAAVSQRDTLTTSLTGRYAWSNTVDTTTEPPTTALLRGAFVTLTERLEHVFSRTLRAGLGAGIGYTVELESGQPREAGLLPTGDLELRYETLAAKGEFEASISVSYAPAVDQTTASIDDWFWSTTRLSWQGESLGMALMSQGALSTDSSGEGRTYDFNAEALLSYALPHNFRAETGFRFAWQRFEGAISVPPSETIFLAISWAMPIPLN